MSPLTSAMAIKALDGLSARSVATAENIANAQTRGYRPVRVDFEQALAMAAADGSDAVRGLQPRFLQATVAQDVRLDLELAAAASTSGRYAAVVELLSRQMQIDALAVSGGR